MLPINSRVKKALFPQILKAGVFVHSLNFYLRLLDRKDQKPSLFSFVVPNKVIKTSVGRHLLKRKMSASVEKLLTTLKPGFLGIFLAKKDVSALPYGEIEKEIKELVKKAKLL